MYGAAEVKALGLDIREKTREEELIIDLSLIVMNENCTITVPGNLVDENIDIDEPVLFEENKIIPLQNRIIQGIVFRPYKSTLLPCSIKFVGKSEQDIIKMPGCCEYKVVYSEN